MRLTANQPSSLFILRLCVAMRASEEVFSDLRQHELLRRMLTDSKSL